MTPGWYGKLPTLGDFASRRLDPAFIEPWDRWLGDGLTAQREQLGDAWLDAYLASPVWRFVLMPGVMPGEAGGTAQAGVLMPSVDRVGRYFPLTLVAPLAVLPRSASELEAVLGWLQRLEDTAVDAMQDDWVIDDLEAELAQLEPPRGEQLPWPQHLDTTRDALIAALASGGGFVDVQAVRGRAELASLVHRVLGERADAVAPATAGSAATWRRGVEGMSFWLAENPEAPRLLVSRGLPTPEDFAAMLGAGGAEPEAATLY